MRMEASSIVTARLSSPARIFTKSSSVLPSSTRRVSSSWISNDLSIWAYCWRKIYSCTTWVTSTKGTSQGKVMIGKSRRSATATISSGMRLKYGPNATTTPARPFCARVGISSTSVCGSSFNANAVVINRSPSRTQGVISGRSRIWAQWISRSSPPPPATTWAEAKISKFCSA